MAKSGIKEWELITEVASDGEDVTVDGRTMRVGSKLEVKRPVFNDGNKGRPVLELTIFKDNWTFRFRIPRSGPDEASVASKMLTNMVSQIEPARVKLEEAWAAYEKERKEDMDKRVKKHNEVMEEEKRRGGRRSRSAGKGLGRYSRPGKTKRSREKRRGENHAQ